MLTAMCSAKHKNIKKNGFAQTKKQRLIEASMGPPAHQSKEQ